MDLCNLIEIAFYSNKGKGEIINAEDMIWTWDLLATGDTLVRTLLAIYRCNISIWPSTVIVMVLRVCHSRIIIDRFCQDERFELTYYSKTLLLTAESEYVWNESIKGWIIRMSHDPSAMSHCIKAKIQGPPYLLAHPCKNVTKTPFILFSC